MHKEFIIKVNPVKYNETVSEVNNGIKTEIVIFFLGEGEGGSWRSRGQ